MRTWAATVVVALLPFSVAHANVHENAVEELNELLRGELSAIETYEQALEKTQGDMQTKSLQGVLSDHQQAADKIKKHVLNLGGTPSSSSGVWGTWAQTIEGGAKMIGNSAALKALKEGEEHGLSEYKEILADEDVPQTVKEDLRAQMPKQEEHIRILDKFI